MFRGNLAQTGARYAKPGAHLDFDALNSPCFCDEMVSGVARPFTMGSILSSPVVDEDILYFGSADGYLYALM